jgi:toxin FitB
VNADQGIVLDTNVVSEPNRAQPHTNVARWFAAQAGDRLYVTTTTIAEIAFGIALLDRGRRRQGLDRWLNQAVLPAFAGRILAFETEDALRYGELMAKAHRSGQAPGVADGEIAAIAHRRGFALATRDTDRFAAFDLPLIDPWRTTPR